MSLLALPSFPALAADNYERGIYGGRGQNFVVIGATLSPLTLGQRYLFPDGRRGNTGESGALVTCADNVATVTLNGEHKERWPRQQTRETDVSFDSAGTRLAGRLIEPAGVTDVKRPLVVMVHGSEKTAAIGSIYAYMFAGQGVTAFVYDKRGTGASAGEFTQNFELLAEDAAQALTAARRAAAGRFDRAGFFGGSQGGWVAPLAATRAPADFVAVGFGLVISPVEEDRAQLLGEAREMRLDATAMGQIERLSQATGMLLRSHFTVGFEELAAVRRESRDATWARTIEGEYSGDVLRMTDADLRRLGRARFDNLELIWDYNAAATLTKLKTPLLWVMAGDDREAPIEATRATLLARIRAGQTIDAYVFPDTDHGIFEYRINPDGTRTNTRVTDGYLKLLADWIKLDVSGSYGRAIKLK